EAKAGSVKEERDQAHVALQAVEHLRHFPPAEDRGEATRSARAYQAAKVSQRAPQYVPIQEEEGAQRLHLGAVRNLTPGCQVVQPLEHLLVTHLERVAHTVEAYEADDPGFVCLLGAR